MQHLFGEFAIGQMGELRAERQDVEHVDAQRLQGPGLLVGLHQQEGGLVRPEIGAGMGIEGDHAQLAAELAGGLGGERDHLLVAAMDAVEIAHGQRRAAVAVRQVLPALDDSQTPHLSLRGAMIRASPSTTVLPFTRQTVSKVAWPLSASSAFTVTRATTGSPIFTGRRKRSDWDR